MMAITSPPPIWRKACIFISPLPWRSAATH
jgi:hypothetical protein